jgi:ribosomal protein L4
MDELKMAAPKTADARNILTALSKNDSFSDILSKRKNSAFIAMSERDENTEKSFSNFANVKMDELRKLSVLDLLNTKYLVLPNAEAAVEFFKSKVNTKK